MKKFMVVNRRAPYGSAHALESLEMALISAAFDQDVHVAFLDDGVLQLKRGQNTTGIGMKDFSPAFRALEDHGVEKLFVERESLEERGLTAADLVVPADVVDRAEMARLMAAMDVILTA